MFPHLINKACYAAYWGYEYIFNMSWGFPDDIRSRTDTSPDHCYLDWGHWHRVPQLIAMLDTNNSQQPFDWILWADMDYIFNSLQVPIESLIAELELVHHLHNVHVVVPDDGLQFDPKWKFWFSKYPQEEYQYMFSSFAVLIRNSDFGRTVLQHWLNFAKGLCPKGNYNTSQCQPYVWSFADQPGLWYALSKTYSEMVPGSGAFDVFCDDHTGLLQVQDYPDIGVGQFAHYFHQEGLVKSSNYAQIPKDQPIIWSSFQTHSLSGLGFNADPMFPIKLKDRDGVFALHQKGPLPQELANINTHYCQATQIANCQAGFDPVSGLFGLGCLNQSVVVHDQP